MENPAQFWVEINSETCQRLGTWVPGRFFGLTKIFPCYSTTMGKRSGFPHQESELTGLSGEDLLAELRRLRVGLRISPSAKMSKLWQKRIHRLEAELLRRSG